MARLPIDLMTVGVRENLPSAVYQPRNASGEDFGAGVGQALQRFGDAGGQLVQHVRAYEEKQQKFDAEKTKIQTVDADSIDFEERLRNLSGNASGFWQEQRERTRERVNGWLETLPEGLRKEMAPQAEQIVASRTKQAFTAQYTQADANTRVTLDEEARKAGLQVNQDPKAYEQTVTQAEALIDASPLTPLEKTQKKAALRNSLAYTAEQARAQQNPTEVVAQSVGGGLREKIKGKESGGDATAQNPTSSARGIYQFLDGTWNNFAGKAGVPAVTSETKGTANDPRNSPAFQEKVMDQYIAASTAELTANRLPVTDANLYLLHFMGQGGGVKFLRALNNDAGATASSAFPTEASKNRSVFFSRNEPRTLSEVYSVLTKGLDGGKTTPSATTASRSQLNAAQVNAVDESARRSLVQQAAVQSAANDAAVTQQRDATYVAIKEGPNPEATLQEARRSGLISSYDQIVKAEKILEDRNKGDDDLQVGLSLMAGGRSGSNPYDKTHKDGLDAVYNAAIKGGADQAAAAAAVFDRTGVVPPSFALALRGALTKDDPSQLGPAARTAANIIAQSPNALAGVEGKDQIEAAATEYQRLTQGLGLSEQDAAKRIQADARATKDPIKDEVLTQFKKDYLTVDKLNSRLQSQVGGWFGYGAKVPEGPQRSAMASVYGALAEEGMRQFQNPDRALAFADFKMKQQFGTQNGVITRYPPDKAGLPALEGKGHSWINEQAVDAVKDQLGVVVEPSQISFVAISGRDGVNTAQAFNNGGADVTRSDSRPGQQSTFKSVPYQIVVMPKPGQPEAAVQVLNGAFFPDVDSYVAKANAARTTAAAVPRQMYDQFGIPFDTPANAPELLDTPTQAARRKQAEANAALLESQAAERKRQADAPGEPRRKAREMLSGGFGVPVDGF